ncbi:MAG TPA: GtrA family protein [Verrucomicrobiae bacterium]|nr:GtrA family protein [Verrucomicrobiae bacterium]
MTENIQHIQRKDVVIAGSVGLVSGSTGVLIVRGLGFALNYRLSFAMPAVSAPLFVLVIYLGQVFSRRWRFLNSFTRFGVIGFCNASVDFGILNILVSSTGVTRGVYFSLYKTIAFVAALINSYFWNRAWTFKVKQEKSAGEAVRFVLVILGSLLINVGVSSLIVNLVPPPFGLTNRLWLNIASVIAVCFGLFWNFIGMKIFVFNQEERAMLEEAL